VPPGCTPYATAGLRAAEANEEARTSLNKLFVQHFQKNVGKCMLKKNTCPTFS
jgi:hypothetical protein